jgi:hypothetical protein
MRVQEFYQGEEELSHPGIAKTSFYTAHLQFESLKVLQEPYRKRLEEEEGGDTHATYAYVAAEAAAKEAGVEPIGQVSCLNQTSYKISPQCNRWGGVNGF